MAAIMRGAQAQLKRFALAADPNVIPFIDVLLVLLIIFMVTAPLPTVDVRVDLPPVHPRHVVVDGEKPTIVALREGAVGVGFFVDDEPVLSSQLGALTLQHAIRNNPGLNVEDIFAEARIFLRADQSTAYGNVVDVMSQLQEAGFVKVGIFAETASEG
jgi:biopolymer transport protein ExbD